MARLLWLAMWSGVLLVCSCTKPPSVPDSGSGVTPRLQARLSVSWEPLELRTSKARVMAHLKRLGPTGALSVRIEVPPMARMTMGRTMFDVPANTSPDEVLEPIEVTYDQLPVQDLVLHVTGTGPNSDLSYAVPYRFGRTAATQPKPE